MSSNHANLKKERLGIEKYNNYGDLMKVIEYNNANDILIEFQDEWKETKRSCWANFKRGNIINPHITSSRLGKTKYNNQGCLMKVVEYYNALNIVVEFQDEYKYKTITRWELFKNGSISNAYFPQVYEHGIIGDKYKIKINGKETKEYTTWHAMMQRCFSDKVKIDQPAYKDVTCCKEWLLFENFYDWLHSQENFDKWKDMYRSAIDKDILVKGNKIYSPDTCCLVPYNINGLFTKRKIDRGDSPIGVNYHKRDKVYEVHCNDGNGNQVYLGRYDNQDNAFCAYKKYKENLIKQIAQEEYKQCNIDKRCYEAMMKYEVEITD